MNLKSGQKILIVDDAQEVVDLIQAMLEGQGYEVVTAANGVEGLEQARKEHPKVIIADVLMPEMDGFIFFKELKKDPRTERIPVIILTARAKMEDSFRAMGVDGFLPKPLDANQLLAEVAREMSVFIKEQDHVDEHPETPKTVDDLAPDKQPVQSAHSGTTGGKGFKKALIFGYEKTVISSMCQQLQQRKYQGIPVSDSATLLSEMNRLDPEMVLLELKADMSDAVRENLMNVNNLIKQKELEGFESKAPPAIILYKVHHAVSGVSSASGDLADTTTLLSICESIGFSKFIGLYSPFTFLMKIKDHLRRN